MTSDHMKGCTYCGSNDHEQGACPWKGKPLSEDELERELLPALRQYMHNDGSGLLAGYDLAETQRIAQRLLAQRDAEIERLGVALSIEAKDKHEEIMEGRRLRARVYELEDLLREAHQIIGHHGWTTGEAATYLRIEQAIGAKPQAQEPQQ